VKGRVGLVEEGRMYGIAGDFKDVRHVPAASPFRVVGVNGPPGDGCDRRLPQTQLR
jgi:hypothetical protein